MDYNVSRNRVYGLGFENFMVDFCGVLDRPSHPKANQLIMPEWLTRCPGVPVSRCPGVPVSRCPGVPVSRCPGDMPHAGLVHSLRKSRSTTFRLSNVLKSLNKTSELHVPISWDSEHHVPISKVHCQ